MSDHPPVEGAALHVLTRGVFRIVVNLVLTPWLTRASIRLVHRLHPTQKHSPQHELLARYRWMFVMTVSILQLAFAAIDAMFVPKSAYQVLGVSVDADYATVKKVFNHNAKLKHPDHGGLSEDFISIQEAWQAIKHATVRLQHNRLGYIPLHRSAMCWFEPEESGEHCFDTLILFLVNSLGLSIALVCVICQLCGCGRIKARSWKRSLLLRVLLFCMVGFNCLHGILLLVKLELNDFHVDAFFYLVGLTRIFTLNTWTEYQVMFLLHDIIPSLICAIILARSACFAEEHPWRRTIYVEGPADVFKSNMWWKYGKKPMMSWLFSYIPRQSYEFALAEGKHFVVFETRRDAKLAVSSKSRKSNSRLTCMKLVDGPVLITSFEEAHQIFLDGERARRRKQNLSKKQRANEKRRMDYRWFWSYVHYNFEALLFMNTLCGDIIIFLMCFSLLALYYSSRPSLLS